MTTIEISLLLLNSVILPLSGWTLYTVHSLAKGLAIEAVYGKSHAAEIIDIRTRQAALEKDIVALRIEVERLKR
ncbi:MAG: hypothetical protein LBK99_05755 [Opitutaceae bacterium]|jgi:hypothetical protein|nr:hypothetical protein [Opitutaceae bacterium]